MAQLIPASPQALAAHPSAIREIETLEVLARELPDEYRVFHGVHWTRIKYRFTIFGEVDFAVVAPSGRLLLIEQKSGDLLETPEGLAKQYPTKTKLVSPQMARSAGELMHKFAKIHGGRKPEIETLLYCPDYKVDEPGDGGDRPRPDRRCHACQEPAGHRAIDPSPSTSPRRPSPTRSAASSPTSWSWYPRSAP